MSRRVVGASRFDIVAQKVTGAQELFRMIHHDQAHFQAQQSLYIQTSVESFDDFEDDLWAMALEAIRPGNIAHSLKEIKIELVGKRWFEAYSTAVISSSSTADVSRSLESSGAVKAMSFLAERAFIKGLFNIRGVERVEISGPMPAELKKQLAVAMTTRPGCRVREWQKGGGLRTDDDIAWGTWAASMHPSDEKEATTREPKSFAAQTVVPRQPMQFAEGTSSHRSSGPSDWFARPKIPLVDAPETQQAEAEAAQAASDGFLFGQELNGTGGMADDGDDMDDGDYNDAEN